MAPPAPPSRQLIAVLIIAMLVTGCSNSLWSKWQDMQCVENCDDPDPSKHKAFEQPVWQTLTMFCGEFACLVVHGFLKSRANPFRPRQRAHTTKPLPRNVSRLQSAPLSRPDESAILFNDSAISLREDERPSSTSFDSAGPGKQNGSAHPPRHGKHDEHALTFRKAILFWLPSLCDILGTTTMNVGLLFVPVSIYQMLRGALVLFTGFFSTLMLNRKLSGGHWAALATVMGGVAVVGLSSLDSSKGGGAGATALGGVCLILFAQVFIATQFVIEERILGHHHVEPLAAVGCEGLWGSMTTLFALPFLHFFIGRTEQGQGGYFDAPVGFHQIMDNPRVWGSSIAIMISIALFNYCGLAVTKTISAASRSTIDTSRTVGIWLVSLYLGWETFKWLQVLGFGLLVYGTFIFNEILLWPAWTGLTVHPDTPAIMVEDDLESTSGSDGTNDDRESLGRSRTIEPDVGARPHFRRSGSGRRGEVSPLLKAVD